MRLIDADALLKEWRLECGGACFVGKGRYCMHYDKTKSICTLIVKAPTIEAEPKPGRWKQIAHPWYECSECGERTAVVNLNGKVLWHYCPNCGAKMDEVEE